MSFYDKLYNSVGVDPNSKNAMLTMKRPVTNKSTFQVFKKKEIFQADLIYLPEDNGYTYVLVVVDVASRIMDAQPLKGRTGIDVIDGFEQILKRKYIRLTHIYILYTDPGSEFKNRDFAQWCDDNSITHRTTKTARKNQMAVVEYMNHIITKVLGVKMTADKLSQNADVYDWVSKLKPLVKAINENTNHEGKPIKTWFKDPIIGKNEKIYKVGDLVHIPLEQPKDALSGQRLHGKFRHGDQRYETDARKITRVAIYPNQPVRYMVEGVENASYLGSELLPVT
ncbi:MAG: DDE-type integrase/transposase/recombinase, partial [Flavobacteriaceae bacterium]|nr:DDE-type integrase/transposase/recombinase [Flavobacteriaceae bacterium]